MILYRHHNMVMHHQAAVAELAVLEAGVAPPGLLPQGCPPGSRRPPPSLRVLLTFRCRSPLPCSQTWCSCRQPRSGRPPSRWHRPARAQSGRSPSPGTGPRNAGRLRHTQKVTRSLGVKVTGSGEVKVTWSVGVKVTG